MDMGGVYQTGNKLQFYGPDSMTPVNYKLSNFNDIKRSVGVAVQWLAPLGLFRFSLWLPLNVRRGDGITTWGDQTEVSSSRSAGLLRPKSAKKATRRRASSDTRRLSLVRWPPAARGA